MTNNQYEFITTLQYRIKNLQAQVDAFKTGSKYQQMEVQYKSMLHTEECRIHKLEFELSKAHAQTIDVRPKVPSFYTKGQLGAGTCISS